MSENVKLKAEVDLGDSGKSLKELKQDVKDLSNELSGLDTQSEKYRQTLKKIADTKDEIDDLNEAIAANTGAGKFQAFANLGQSIASGFQAAQGAMVLFGNEGEEVGKILMKIQAASAVAEGLKGVEGLADAWKNVAAMLGLTATKQGVVVAATEAQAVADLEVAAAESVKAGATEAATASQWSLNAAMYANPAGVILIAVLALGAALYGLNAAMTSSSEENKKLNAESDITISLSKKKLEVVDFEIDRITQHIDLLKAQGASTKELRKQEEQLYIENLKKLALEETIAQNEIDKHKRHVQEIKDNDDIFESIENVIAAGARKIGADKIAEQAELFVRNKKILRAEEDLKAIKEQEEALKRSVIAREKLETEHLNALKGFKDTEVEQYKKAQEKIDKESEEAFKRRRKAIEDARQAAINENNIEAQLKAEDDLKAASVEYQKQIELNAIRDIDAAKIQASLNEYEDGLRKKSEREAELKQEIEHANKKISVSEGYYSSVKTLATSVFEITNNLGAQDEKSKLERAKRQFNIQKGLDITGALINGARAVTQVIATTPAPLWPIGITAAGIITAAQVAAIASKQFGGGGAGGASASLSNAVGGSSSFQPQNILSNSTGNTQTQLDANGNIQNKPPMQKVVILQSEISGSLKTEKTTNQKATIE